MIDEHTINRYLEENPDASLKDFCQHINSKHKEEKEAEDERLRLEREYFNEHYKGKYVRIDFHSNAHTLVGPIPADACYRSTSTDMQCIDIYNVVELNNNNSLKIEIGKRPVNYYWLTNPYFAQGMLRNTNTTCTVISKEKFDGMKEFAISLLEMTNNKLEEL